MDAQASDETGASSPLMATAHWTAAVRAMESARDDRLIDDPWATALAGEVGQAWIAGRTASSVVPIVLRTRFFDDFMQRVAREEDIRQIVLVAAGLDTRAFRLEWPDDTHVFEVDQAEVLQHKARVLERAGAQPGCKRSIVKADLAGPWTADLVAAGLNPQAPTLWLIEGLLFYVPNEHLRGILDGVTHLAAPGSWIGFDIVNSVTLTHPLVHDWIEMQAQLGAPWIGTLDDPVEYLAGRGWRASLTQAGQPDASYGRWPFPVLPTLMPGVPHNWFVTARKEG
ncbi:MAG: SAM-dependent methyltransferase [Anaerolineae bacterium]|nr:SAM-dependent methyltransferase [Anaerolineae bacterium]